MKSRLLTKILNNTGYNVENHGDYIAVGSPLCHDLIKVEKETLELSYALSTFNLHKRGTERREADKVQLRGKDNAELLFIYETLERLILSGEIKDIIDGQDEIENPLIVYTTERNYNDGTCRLIQTYIDNIEWPRKDRSGVSTKTMDGKGAYNNTHFLKIDDAVNCGVKEEVDRVVMFNEQIEEWKKKIAEREAMVKQCYDNMTQIQRDGQALGRLIRKP